MSIDIAPLDDYVPIDVDAFELLWRAHACVHIAETVVYKFGKLESWFFNAKTNGPEAPAIRKKRDYTVRRGDVNQTIMEAFCANCSSGNDLVATWVSGEPNEPCKVVHLTKRLLHQFLNFVSEKGHGVLQRWSAPFDGHNALLRADWSPHHFSLELCTNWHSVRPPRTRHHVPVDYDQQSYNNLF